MFNPFSVIGTTKSLEKLLKSGRKSEEEARAAFLNMLRSSNYQTVTPELREVLAFALGFFASSIASNSSPESTDMACIYSSLCVNIANGHIALVRNTPQVSDSHTRSDIMKKTTLFLGGTTDNDYRDSFTDTLIARGVPHELIFNPIVEDWNEEAQRIEDEMKASPDVIKLFYLTGNEDGMFLSSYSLTEGTLGLMFDAARTAIVFDYTHLTPKAAKYLRKVYADLKLHFPAANIFESLSEAEDWYVEMVRQDTVPVTG